MSSTFDAIVSVDRVDPVEGLAWESEALRRCESGGGEPSVRIWESAYPCVILPRHGRAHEWVHVDACRDRGIPTLRRESGGGAVVLGPGCLCVSLVIDVDAFPICRDVAESYCWLLDRLIAAFAIPELRREGSDLMLGSRKVAGHAQRRLRTAMLHHGSLLYDFDLALIEQVLPEPPRCPAHRGDRVHRDFLANLPIRAEDLCVRLRRWSRLLQQT